MRSAPSLYATGADMAGTKSVIDTSELTHPLSVELKRWQKFSEFSEKEMKHQGTITLPKKKAAPESPKAPVRVGGLVNFPKYMLIHNCHLKQRDQIRYVQEENAKRELAEETARRYAQLGEEPGMMETQMSELAELKKVASWGQPTRFNTAEERGKQWAGNPMPQGRGSRTSNPFTTG